MFAIREVKDDSDSQISQNGNNPYVCSDTPPQTQSPTVISNKNKV